MTALEHDLLPSPYFRLQAVAPGIYAAISREGEGAAMSNSGIVDLGDRTLVFDTFMTPLAAQDVRDAAVQLTGRSVSLVVNSHWHDDHVFGNQDFEGAEILATERTRDLILTDTARSVEKYRTQAPAFVHALEEQLRAAADAGVRRRLEADIRFGQVILAALPTLQLTPPTRVFSTSLSLAGPRRKAELLTYGGGHTQSDAFLYLPDDRLLFAGDLVVIQEHPWIGDGDLAQWQGILSRLAQLDIATLVPGHGPVGGRDAIGWMQTYLGDLSTLVTDAIERGLTDDQIGELPILQKYADLGDPGLFGRNLRFLLRHRALGSEPRHDSDT